MGTANAAAPAAKGPSEAIFVAEFILLLLFGRLAGELMQRLGQPPAVGQLLAGIALGPVIGIGEAEPAADIRAAASTAERSAAGDDWPDAVEVEPRRAPDLATPKLPGDGRRSQSRHIPGRGDLSRCRDAGAIERRAGAKRRARVGHDRPCHPGPCPPAMRTLIVLGVTPRPSGGALFGNTARALLDGAEISLLLVAA